MGADSLMLLYESRSLVLRSLRLLQRGTPLKHHYNGVKYTGDGEKL